MAKKFLMILLALCVVFALVSCDTGSGQGKQKEEGGKEEGGKKGGKEKEGEYGEDLWTTEGILYKDGKFTIGKDSVIVATKKTDSSKPHQIEFAFGADDGMDDTPDVSEYKTLTVKLASGITWDWGPQFQIGGNATKNTSSWTSVDEWGGSFEKFSADKSSLTVSVADIVQLKKVMLASGGGSGGSLKFADVLEISAAK